MRWPVKKCDWRRSFAWLPVKIGDEWVWLERYESRPMGEYREVRATLAQPKEGEFSLSRQQARMDAIEGEQ